MIGLRPAATPEGFVISLQRPNQPVGRIGISILDGLTNNGHQPRFKVGSAGRICDLNQVQRQIGILWWINQLIDTLRDRTHRELLFVRRARLCRVILLWPSLAFGIRNLIQTWRTVLIGRVGTRLRPAGTGIGLRPETGHHFRREG
ncbi:hypothetical protein [Paracoccus sp. M683]|uniref:hypothetical protein n=1 Tax=Paracoccus sp. M683 TaxID=2594268 RepID=UPI00163DA0AF|nr:hypothetical protein [Paracoccus sp. M683]